MTFGNSIRTENRGRIKNWRWIKWEGFVSIAEEFYTAEEFVPGDTLIFKGLTFVEDYFGLLYTDADGAVRTYMIAISTADEVLYLQEDLINP